MVDQLADKYEKKKLQGFLQDILRIGCLKGFRYFSMYLRGREELLLKVQNEQMPSRPTDFNFYQEVVTYDELDDEEEEEEEEEGNPSSYPSANILPRAYESLMLSKSTMRSLSGFHFLDIGLPPASPCETDRAQAEPQSTMYLLAAYARYKSPYVWVRSNHNRLVQFSDTFHTSHDEIYQIQDSPLKLKSTGDWAHKDIRIWHIIAEIIRINVIPCPRNPFAIDYAYFDSLSNEDCYLATGAVLQFLERMVLHGDHSYHTKELINARCSLMSETLFPDHKLDVTQQKDTSQNVDVKVQLLMTSMNSRNVIFVYSAKW